MKLSAAMPALLLLRLLGVAMHARSDDTADPAACLPGSYSSTGSAPCTRCDTASFQKYPGATGCIAHATCKPGSRVIPGFPGTTTADRRCEVCGPAKYQDQVNAGECLPWTRCKAGTFVDSDPSTSYDRICAACPPGHFQPDDALMAPLSQGGANCTAWSPVCGPGTYQTEPVSTRADRDCAKCNWGTFQPKADKTECRKALEACPHGSVQLAPPTLTTDRVCHSTTPTTTPTSSGTTSPTTSGTTTATSSATTTATTSLTTSASSTPTTTLTTTTTPTTTPTTTTSATTSWTTSGTTTATTTPTQSTTTTTTVTTYTSTTMTTTTQTSTTRTDTATSTTATATTTTSTTTTRSSTTTSRTSTTTSASTTTTATATATSSTATSTTTSVTTTTTETTSTITSTTGTTSTATTTTQTTATTTSASSTATTTTAVRIAVATSKWWDADEAHLAIGVCAAAVLLFLGVVVWFLHVRCGCCTHTSRCGKWVGCKDGDAGSGSGGGFHYAHANGGGGGDGDSAVNPQRMIFEDYGQFQQYMQGGGQQRSMYNHDEPSMYSSARGGGAVAATTTNPHYHHHHGQFVAANGRTTGILESTFDDDDTSSTRAARVSIPVPISPPPPGGSGRSGVGGGGGGAASMRTVTFADDGMYSHGNGTDDLNTTAEVVAQLKAAADRFDQSEHVWKLGADTRSSMRSLYDDFNPADAGGSSIAEAGGSMLGQHLSSFGGGGNEFESTGVGGHGNDAVLPTSSAAHAAAHLSKSRTVIVETGGAGIGIAIDACSKLLPGSSGVCVVAVAESSAAAKTGQVVLGDVITSVNNKDLTGATVAEVIKEITDTNIANGCFVLGIASIDAVVDAVHAKPATQDPQTIRTYDAWNASFSGGGSTHAYGTHANAAGAHAGADAGGAATAAGFVNHGWDGRGNVDTPVERNDSAFSPPPPPPPPPPMPAAARPTESPPAPDFAKGTALKQRLKQRRSEPAAADHPSVTQNIKAKIQQRREDAEGSGHGAPQDGAAAGNGGSGDGGNGGRSTAPIRIATARYDFEAADPTQLALEKGEVLTLIEDRDLWVLAENMQGDRGVVPKNYVVGRGTVESTAADFVQTDSSNPPQVPASDEEDESWA